MILIWVRALNYFMVFPTETFGDEIKSHSLIFVIIELF